VEYVVLVNKAAGRSPVDPGEIESALARHAIEHTIEVVDGVENMRNAVVDVVRRGRRLALAGGDGTLGLAMDALVNAGLAGDAPPVAVLPVGTGCDFLRTFAIPQDLVGAAAHLVGDQAYRIDLGQLEGDFGRTVFVNIAQAGAGAAAAETAPRLPRGLGSARYPVAFGLRLARFPATEVEIDGETKHAGHALAVIMANGQFFAGGWNVAPKALLNDRKLDVQIIDAKKRQAPALVPKIVKGVHLGRPGVTRYSISSFELRTGVPWPVEADGDYRGTTPVRVETLPAAVSVKI
jgi:YegS/Rv2252/BmrU family lipid kinase